MAHGIDVGDAEKVGHDARGARAAPADPRRARGDGLHDEEIVGEALLANDRQLAVEPRADRGIGIAAVAVQDPRLAARSQYFEGLPPLERIGREDGLAHGPIHGALLPEARRVLEGSGRVREERLHLRRAHERSLGLRQVLPGHAVQRRVPRDGAERVVDAVPRAVDEVDVVRRDGRDALPAGPVEERPVPAAGHQLGVDGERFAERREEITLRAQEHQRGGVLTHGALEGELGIQVARGQDMAEGAIALAPAGQEHRAGGRRALRLHHLGARDGREPPLLADLPVEHEAVERVRVGEREAVHAALAGRVGQSLERLRAAHEGVMAMDVEMDER